MAGITGVVGDHARERCSDDFLDSIDLLGSGHRRTLESEDLMLAAAAASERLADAMFIEREGFTVAVAGHLVVDRDLDWPGLLDELRNGEYARFEELSGRFALALHDEAHRHLYLVTDRLGQYPLYALKRRGNLAFSTAQASFCRWGPSPRIDRAWFHELFLANFSAAHRSFLTGVERLPPATVRRVSLRDGESVDARYMAPYSATPSSNNDRSEVERAIALFTDRVPRYLGPEEHAVMGATSGFDSRTILALTASRPNVSVFTYGTPGCEDILVGQQLAAALGRPHQLVPFDEQFERDLPELMVETVWLSGGLQSCSRSTLVNAYRRVMANLPDTDVILSGVSGDQLLRGHGNVPSIVSSFVSHLFETGGYPDSLEALAREAFVEPDIAVEGMAALRSDLEDRYGTVTETPAHIGYLTYEAPAEYFAGEACLADNFGDFRTPFCDRELVGFAYSTHLSSLRFSRYRKGDYGNRHKNYLVANLVGADRRVAAVPVQRRPVSAFASGSALHYFTASAWSKIRRTLRREQVKSELEHWSQWYAGPMRGRIESLLKPDARCEAIVRRPFIDRCLAASDAFWLNKIVTTELVLRLAENGWRRTGELGEG